MNSNLNFKKFFYNHSTIMLIINPDTGKIMDANSKALKFYQYTKDEIKNLTIFDINQLPNKEVRKNLSFAKTRKEENFFFPHKLKNGEIRFVEVFSTIYMLENGEEVLISTVNDITQKYQKEIELKREQKLANRIIELLPGYFFVIDKDKNIKRYNFNAKEKFKCDDGEKCFLALWGGRYLSDQYKNLMETANEIPPDAKCKFCKADEALEKMETINAEIEDNGKYYKVWFVPFSENEFIDYFVDTTEEKLREERFYKLSITDSLTGIYNRRFTSEMLEYTIELCKRTDKTFSLIMIDIDNFKDINDNYGHNLGDNVLKELAITIKSRLRKADIFGRWGGEEFLIILPETNLLNACYLAEELRSKIENIKIDNIELTASLGVSEFHHDDDLDTIVKRVDDLMYLAKELGKNRVEVEHSDKK